MLCSLCPRFCRSLRTPLAGEGFCRAGTLPLVARAAVHWWEEPCISGTRGSGTIFFGGCSLGCVFCQNRQISTGPEGVPMTPEELSELFRRVEALGVHNVNLVTPTHFAPAIRRALLLYKPGIPVVWNSSGYERPEVLRSLKGLVDVFLPDFKYGTEETGRALADAPDYFPRALEAIRTMCELTGPPVYNEEGLLQRGTLVRHLVLPLRTGESITILDTIATQLPPGTPVSLMRQYTPMGETGIPGLDRRLTPREYRRVFEHMLELNLPGYCQEKEAATAAFTPVFLDEESTRLFPTKLDG